MTHHGQLPEDGLGEKHLSSERLAYPLRNSVWRQIDGMAELQRVTPGTVVSAVFAILLNRLAGEPVPFLSEHAFKDDAHRQLVCLRPEAEANDFAVVVGYLAQANTHDDTRRSNQDPTDPPEDPCYRFTFDIPDEASRREPRQTPPCGQSAIRPPQSWYLSLAVHPSSMERSGQLTVTFDPAAFSLARAHGLARGYLHLLDAALRMPHVPIADLPVADAYDQAEPWPSRPPPPSCALADDPADMRALFHAVVRRWPDATAITWPQGMATFAGLRQTADSLATLLRARGIAPGDIVAVRVAADAPPASSVLYLCAHIATLDLGCAVMPLGQQVSPTQARAQIERLGANFLLSAVRAPDCQPSWFDQALSDGISGFPQAALFTNPLPGPRTRGMTPSPSIVLTSSGTTGTPKTVLLSDAMILGFIRGLEATETFAPAPALINANIGFDIIIADIWMPWIHGHHVVVLETERRTPTVLSAARALGARFTSFSPTVAASLLDQDPTCLREFAGLHVAGEALPLPLARRLRDAAPDTRIVNGYGPSEMAPLSTVWPVEPAGEDRVPIGNSLPGYRVLVADEKQRPLPAHWPGEYCIAAAAPALGYHDAAMTCAAFIELPGQRPGPFFRTDDFGWIDRQGRAHFIGRRDRQVKIHGVRAELDGVEHRICEIEGVADAAVVQVAASGHAPRLVGIVQPAAAISDRTALADRIRAHCGEWLPRAARPAEIVFLETMPKGPSGKKAYRQLAQDLAPKDATQRKTRPADGSIEARLAALWHDILIPRIGVLDPLCVEDDVFASGASSLDVLSMAERIERTFRITVPDDQIFARPTIADQAALVRELSLAAPSLLRQRCQMRKVRAADGDAPCRGVILGLPGIGGNAPYLGVAATHAFRDFDIFSVDVDLQGCSLMEDRHWLDCANLVVEKLLAPGALHPRVTLGFSFGGFMGWLIDRLLVAAGRGSVPIINLDGGLPDNEIHGWRDAVAPLLPRPGSEPSRMLLLQRNYMGRLRVAKPLQTGWTELGVAVETRLVGTVAHLDFNRPAVLVSEKDALATYAETGTCEGHPSPLDPLCSPGGVLFQLLARADTVTSADMRAFLSGLPPGPIEAELRLGLLFLTFMTGDADLALAVTERVMAEAPALRDHIYARIAVLAEIGRFQEAAAVAATWADGSPGSNPMIARANRRSPDSEAANWSRAAGLFLGQSDRALDFAVTRLAAPLAVSLFAS